MRLGLVPRDREGDGSALSIGAAARRTLPGAVQLGGACGRETVVARDGPVLRG